MATDYGPVNVELISKNNNYKGYKNLSSRNYRNYDEQCHTENQSERDVSVFNNNVDVKDLKDNIKHPGDLIQMRVQQNAPFDIMPPPPHKINNNIMLYNYHNNRKANWKKNHVNRRSLSPLGYESDESTKSYCSQGNMPDENGVGSKLPREDYLLYDQSLLYGKFSHSSPSMFCSNNVPFQQQLHSKGHINKKCSYSSNSNSSTKRDAKTPVEIERRVYGLMERFTSRAKLFEINLTPKGLTNGTHYDNLSYSIWGLYSVKAQTSETYVRKLELWQSVYLTIRAVLHRYGLFMVGSTMCGLATENSDIDMCLLVKPCVADTRTDAVTNLEHIRNILENCDFVVDPHVILAKVPILKFRGAKYGFEVDLNCNNAVGIRNTHMLHCYSQLDWRVRPLVIIVKLWAQANDINDAKNMTISSYSLALMVIHYLQCGVAPPVVPCLHGLLPNKFSPSSEIQGIDIQEDPPKFKSDNKMSLVRTGSRLQIDECRYARSPKNDPHQWKYLCIEEPFDLTNTARSVYDLPSFKRIKAVFNKSYKILASCHDLNAILPIADKCNQR